MPAPEKSYGQPSLGFSHLHPLSSTWRGIERFVTLTLFGALSQELNPHERFSKDIFFSSGEPNFLSRANKRADVHVCAWARVQPSSCCGICAGMAQVYCWIPAFARLEFCARACCHVHKQIILII